MEVEVLYGMFYKELLAYCKAMTQGRSSAEDARSSAEDLVQETYLRALTHWNDVEDLSRSQCRAWLYKTARNLYIDQMRKLSREVSEEEELKALPFEEDLSQSAVRQLVARLPNTERLLFSMRYFEGYNSQELGKLFDLPAATVRSRLASAKRRLRQWVEE